MSVDREAVTDRLRELHEDLFRLEWELNPPPPTPPPVVDDAEYSPEPARRRMARKVGKPRRKPEGEIVSEGIAYLNGLAFTKAWKIHGGTYGRVGEPDVDGCSRGRSLKFECKAADSKPTDLQLGRLDEWARVGALVGWFRSTEHLAQLMEHVGDVGFVPDLAHPGCGCGLHVRSA